MQPWHLKPMLVTMLLLAADPVRASSLLELADQVSGHTHSTVSLREIEPVLPAATAPLLPDLAYPIPALHQMPGAEFIELSPSMISIGVELPTASSPSRKTAGTAPHGARRPPQIIRGGTHASPARGPATTPQPSQTGSPTPPKREASRRSPAQGTASPPSSQAPALSTGQPVGEPE
ncbi:hypothetical protein AB2N04_16160 [Nitratireductor sp. GISD-1A_MAKvit]|uniref:hypothetical protein n=1 Tax=Nitratireductor sp. GISD-1A_MAKvit TaxID=3234198 RepID=UPI0034670FFD